MPKADDIFEQRRAFAQSSHSDVVVSSSFDCAQIAASRFARTPASGSALRNARKWPPRAAGTADSRRRSAAIAAGRRAP